MNNVAQRSFGRLGNESGVILIVTSICAFLMALLVFSMSIDLPFTHSADLKAQHALDVGTASGLYAFHSYGEAAYAAADAASSVMSNEYGAGSYGVYSHHFADDGSRFRIAIPRFNAGAAAVYSTNISGTPTPLSAAEMNVFNRVFDPMGIQDYKNGIFAMARVKPLQFFGTDLVGDESYRIEVASVARMITTLSYVLVDPAFPVGENYDSIFGPVQFGEVGYQTDTWSLGATGYQAPGWTWPSWAGARFKTNPLDGTPLVGTPEYKERIYRFYTAMCDTLPWSYYKGAAVDLIDLLTASSAFNYTTYVGLPGYQLPGVHPTWPLVAIHPVQVAPGDVFRHPYNPGGAPGASDFPLQENVDLNYYNHFGLYGRKSQAFGGFVDSATPDPGVSAMYNRGARVNDWSLGYCSALFYEDSTNPGTEFLLAADNVYKAATDSDEAELYHESISERRRSSVFHNWLDDDTGTACPQGPAPCDLRMDLDEHQSGAGGDTPRNLIAGLAPRVRDLKIQNVANGTWTRPNNPGDVGNHNEPLDPGNVYLPLAMNFALDVMRNARQDYNAHPVYGSLRPIAQSALIVFGFGPWSESAYGQLLDSGAKTEEEMVNDFATALGNALCGNGGAPKTSVILAFLPMNGFNINSIVAVQDVIGQYEQFYNWQQQGSPPGGSTPGVPQGCADATGMAPIFFFIADYREYDSLSSDHERKISAAAHFQANVPKNIMTALIKYVFPT